MQLTFDKRAKVVIVELPESVTGRNGDASNLKLEFNKLILEGFKNIIVSMEKTNKIDTSGLSAILVLKRLCINAGGEHVLVSVQPHIYNLIQTAQLAHILNIENTIQGALDLIAYKELKKETHT